MCPAPAPESVKASPKLRKMLIGETDAFVRTAVRRDDLAASWPLIHPNLKQGLSKKEWLTGDIPVVPFPAKAIIAWDLDWSYQDDVAADVVLQPIPKSGLYRKTFTIEFKRVGAGSENRWLVYSWVPSGVSQALIDDEHAAGVAAALEHVRGHQGLSPVWILVPVGIILTVFMLPLARLPGRPPPLTPGAGRAPGGARRAARLGLLTPVSALAQSSSSSPS